MTTWELHEEKNLVKDKNIKNAFEFSNINQAYQGKHYKYAYMVKNVLKTNGSVVKLNVDEGTIIEDIMPTGMFPTGSEKFLSTRHSSNFLCNFETSPLNRDININILNFNIYIIFR